MIRDPHAISYTMIFKIIKFIFPLICDFFFQKVTLIFSKPSKARGLNFFFTFWHPKDDINQFVACSQIFARSMQFFPGLLTGGVWSSTLVEHCWRHMGVYSREGGYYTGGSTKCAHFVYFRQVQKWAYVHERPNHIHTFLHNDSGHSITWRAKSTVADSTLLWCFKFQLSCGYKWI